MKLLPEGTQNSDIYSVFSGRICPVTRRHRNLYDILESLPIESNYSYTEIARKVF
jgi:hypothetical protein